MKREKLPLVIKTKESILAIQVCAAIPPERAVDELEDAVAYAIMPPGTMNNRWVLSDDPEHIPVECAVYEGRWHYILVC